MAAFSSAFRRRTRAESLDGFAIAANEELAKVPVNIWAITHQKLIEVTAVCAVDILLF